MTEETEQWIKSFWIRLKVLWERSGERGENVSLGMTDKVSAVRCCLYQLFPYCVWLSRRWVAQRCPPGLKRRRTGRGAWRDKNLISLQPFVASPTIPSSSHPRRTTEWYYRYTDMKKREKAPLFSTACLMVERQNRTRALLPFLLTWLPSFMMLYSLMKARWRLLTL